MPVEKRKKSKDEKVPDLGDPDRKRVLNVLAQRRYRQRRREKLVSLETQVKALTPPDEARVTTESPADPNSHAQTISQPTDDSKADEEFPRQEDECPFEGGFDFSDSALDFPFFDDSHFNNLPTPLLSPTYEPSFVGPLSLSTSNAPSESTSSSAGNPTRDTTPFKTPLSYDNYLAIPMLSAIKGFGAIARTLGLSLDLIYQPTYLHTFPSAPYAALTPPNLLPTPAQKVIPHHPIIDTLPWPSVREKMICMLSLPSAHRPPNARNEDGSDGQAGAVMAIAHDMDDFKDGCRVHGNVVGWSESSELAEEAWEVGERFYREWWWAFDARVLKTTNQRRKERGLGQLRIEGARL